MLWYAILHTPSESLWPIDILSVFILLQIVYLALTHGPLARRFYNKSHVTSGRQTASFIVGCWVLYFAMAGPLDYLSDAYIYGAHMVQHMLEITVMTPLLMKGLPESFYVKLWNLRAVGRIIRIWSNPLVAGAVFNIVLTTFHAPSLYNLALNFDAFHFFEHLVFFVIALFMWTPLLVEIPGKRALTNGQKLLYLLYNYNLMMPLVILQLIANHPWYSHYVDTPRLASWLTPIADMQLGAILMMVFMGGAFLVYGIRIYANQDESIWYQ